MTIAQKLANFARCYDKAHYKVWRRSAGLTEDNNVLFEDPLKAIRLFTMYVHERQGASPRFPLLHRLAIIRALGASKFEDALFQDNGFPNHVWNEFVKLTDNKPDEKITKGPVYDFLVKLKESKEPNWLKVLKSIEPKDAFNWLKDIRGIKEKIASFIVRDLATNLILWSNFPQEQLFCLQPLDTWLRFWSKKCWPGDLDKVKGTIRQMIRITERCNSEGVDPAKFNKGAWFVGSHFDYICDFFHLDETLRVNRESCLDYFDATKLEQAIDDYSCYFYQRQVFGV